jgi:hypothetical protein
MFNDILGEKDKKPEVSTKDLISALKANIAAKEELINDLLDQITKLEQQLEYERQL